MTCVESISIRPSMTTVALGDRTRDRLSAFPFFALLPLPVALSVTGNDTLALLAKRDWSRTPHSKRQQ
jgi:hypothetical protein